MLGAMIVPYFGSTILDVKVELEVNSEHSHWSLHHLAICPSEAPHCRQKHFACTKFGIVQTILFVSLGRHGSVHKTLSLYPSLPKLCPHYGFGGDPTSCSIWQ
jgi:hypothetical protein